MDMPRSKQSKRKRDDAEPNGGISKKARQEPPTSSVQLTHEPGEGVQKPVNGQTQDQPIIAPRNDAENIEDQVHEGKRSTKRRAHKRGMAAQHSTKHDEGAGKLEEAMRSAIDIDDELDVSVTMQDDSVTQVEQEGKEQTDETEERKQAKKDGKKKRKEEKRVREAEEKQAAGSQRAVERKGALRSTTKAQDDSALVKVTDGKADVPNVGNDTHLRWTLGEPTAGRFLDVDPVFVRDEEGNEYLISAISREVQLLSVDDSLVVRTCSVPTGCSVETFAVSLHGENTVYVALSDGSLLTWDWREDRSVTRPFQSLGDTKALAVATDSATTEERILCLSTYSGHSAVSMDGDSLYTTERDLHSIRVLGNMDYIVAQGPSAVVCATKKRGQGSEAGYVWTELAVGKQVTCFDIRTTAVTSTSKKDRTRQPGLSLAIGNTEGQIHLYENISSAFNEEGRQSLAPPRILHWHREAVKTVKFSRDGNYLISGGKETVLVLWQLQTGKKQYLPHLTSEIERIVVSPEADRYALQMGDNSIMVLSTSELKPVANFAGLQLAAWSQSHPARLHTGATAFLHPQNANEILLTVPGSINDTTARPFLQTFDIQTSRHVSRQALTRNNVTDLNLSPEKTPIIPPDVAHMQISHDGQWLVTIDEWMPPASDLEHLATDEEQLLAERQKRREVYLKFWQWDGEQGLWSLSTRVDAPHDRFADALGWGAGRVLQLATEPNANGFATVGEDGSVRIWRPKTKTRHGVIVTDLQDRAVIEWTCKRMIELPKDDERRADSPMNDGPQKCAPVKACLAYSGDGSMIAVALLTHPNDGTADGPLLHFINVYSGTIAATRAGMIPSSELHALGFLDRYLVAITRRNVQVWDLIDDRLHHHHKIPDAEQTLLAVNPAGGTFAVVVENKVSVYSVTDTQPACKLECESAVAAVLAAGKGGKGYVLVCEDATVRMLSSTGPATGRRFASLPAAQDVSAEPALEAASTSMTEAEVLDLNAAAVKPEITTGTRPLLEETEDDRPVVRPEQLAKIFDVGQSFAMPPVKDMFEAVVDLFGRRPLERNVVMEMEA